jgi:hypothetical protein
MNAPIRAQSKTADALLPQRMRGKLPPTREPLTITDAPWLAPGTASSDVDLPLPRSRPFEGDIAIKELRRRLTLDPGGVPQPPMQAEQKHAVPRSGSLWLAAIIVAVIGVLAMTYAKEAGKLQGRSSNEILREYLSRAQTLPSPARLVVENQKGFVNEPLPLSERALNPPQ